MTEGTRRLAAVIALLCACNHDLGDEQPDGRSIRGTVTYEGTAAADFSDPAWMILATTTPDPDAIPHALVVLRTDEIDAPQEYELRFLPAGRYYLIAQLVDLDAFDPVASPVGAHPNGCVLTAQPESRSLTVDVVADVENIDVLVRDTIFLDPCFEEAAAPALDECPRSGQMAVGLTVTSTEEIASGDRLVLGLHGSFPPAEGDGTQILARTDLAFPLETGFNEQPAGDYVVYVCLDRGGDAPDGICGDDDVWVVSSSPSTFAVDQVHSVSVDLDAGTVEVTGSVAPDPVACAPTSQLEVRITAVPDIDPPPAPGDILAVTMFDDFPTLTRPPDFIEQAMGPSFPTTITVPADPGDYFVIVCFQREDSPSDMCAGPGDRDFYYMALGGEVVLREGETTIIDAELGE